MPKAAGVRAAGSGAGGTSEFGWYGNMLHDRFYSEWVQPTSVVHSAKLTVLLRIRIQKDGRISDYLDFEIVGQPSNRRFRDRGGGARLNRSILCSAGLGDEYYDVNINFELE